MADWKELSTISHYQTAVAVRDELQAGHVEEAARGIEELIDALSRSERRALRSQLIRLMVHVIKWKTQPARRSRSWVGTINSARSEIEDIREETPSLNDREVQRLWDRCVSRALDEAKTEMNAEPAVRSLDWHDVFEAEYSLDETPHTP